MGKPNNLNKITQEELDKMLDAHELWLKDPIKYYVPEFRAVLEYCDLSGLSFYERNLERVSFKGSYIKGARFIRCRMSNVSFSNVTCLYSRFVWSDMSGATLEDSNIRETYFIQVNLSLSSLRNSVLLGVRFRQCDLSDSDLRYSDLRGAELPYTDLRDTDLSNIKLDSRTGFRNTNVDGIKGLPIYSISNIGSYNGSVVYVPDTDMVFAGCWKGRLSEFPSQGRFMNAENDDKLKDIEFVYEFFKRQKQRLN